MKGTRNNIMKRKRHIVILSLVLVAVIGLAYNCLILKAVVAVNEIQSQPSEPDLTTIEEEVSITLEEGSTDNNNVSSTVTSNESEQEPTEEISIAEEPAEESNISDTEPTYEIKNLLPEEKALLLPNEIVVYTFGEYKAALESSTVTTIYIGADIIMETGGAIINPVKEYLVVDGINPEDPLKTVHNLTDYNSSYLTNTVTLGTNSGPKSITMRNLILYGRNYYGPIAIDDAAKGVTMTFENIEYYGPQLIFNRYGTVHFKEALIHIGRFGGASAPQEVGEVAGVIFEGNVTIKQVEAQINEIFYFYAMAGAIEVKSNAVVNISTFSDSGFIYSAYNVTFTAQAGAEFYYTAPTQFWEAAGCFTAFTVKTDARVHISITGTKVSAVLRVLGPLYVGEGAELLLKSNAGGFAALRMNGAATFENPGCVLLYSPAFRTIVYAAANNMNISAQQLNYWTGAGTGGFDNLPLNTWRKADGSLFTLSGTISAETAGNFTSITSNFGAGDISAEAAPNSSNFSMINARVISFGRLEVDAEYEYLSKTAARVIGTTTPSAEVLLSYADEEGNTVTYNTSADGTGRFIVDLPGPLPDSTAIYIKCRYQYLFTECTISSVEKILQFESVPHIMTFSTGELMSKTEIISRADSDWSIKVYNSLGTGNKWTLTARLAGEMSSGYEVFPVLEDALIFVDENEKTVVLDTDSETLIMRHTTQNDVEITPVSWDADKGILLKIKPGAAYTDVKYTTTIQWILANVP